MCVGHTEFKDSSSKNVSICQWVQFTKAPWIPRSITIKRNFYQQVCFSSGSTTSDYSKLVKIAKLEVFQPRIFTKTVTDGIVFLRNFELMASIFIDGEKRILIGKTKIQNSSEKKKKKHIFSVIISESQNNKTARFIKPFHLLLYFFHKLYISFHAVFFFTN